MTYPEPLQSLGPADIRLSLRLVVDTPAGTITPELRDALAEHKPALLARLGRDALWESLRDVRWGPGDPAPGLVVPRPCGGCLRLECSECNP